MKTPKRPKIRKKPVKNKEGLTLGQQREKVRKAKKEIRDNKVREREEKAKKRADNKLYCDLVFVKGIYFLYDKDKVVYIGMSSDNVLDRVTSHRKGGEKKFDSFTIQENKDLTVKQLLNKEKRLIKEFKPKYNIVHNPRNKSAKKKPLFVKRC